MMAPLRQVIMRGMQGTPARPPCMCLSPTLQALEPLLRAVQKLCRAFALLFRVALAWLVPHLAMVLME